MQRLGLVPSHLSQIDDRIVNKYWDIYFLDRNIADNKDVLFTASLIYRAGWLGIGAYTAYRILGGEAPNLLDNNLENISACLFKYVSPFVVAMGIIPGITSKLELIKLNKRRNEYLKSLDLLFEQEETVKKIKF